MSGVVGRGVAGRLRSTDCDRFTSGVGDWGRREKDEFEDDKYEEEVAELEVVQFEDEDDKYREVTSRDFGFLWPATPLSVSEGNSGGFLGFC